LSQKEEGTKSKESPGSAPLLGNTFKIRIGEINAIECGLAGLTIGSRLNTGV
jgi:hypothetical protein